MGEHDLPPVKPYHPTTFLERGVAVPFTTPLLGGTRARPAAKQCLELVIPNPSGGRGVYIMSWTSITSLCRPTLHDKVFNERIAVLDSVTPATIRRVARTIAAEGLAGEEAMHAAQAAANADKDDRVVTNYKLLMILVEQVSHLMAATTRAGPEPIGPAARAQMTVDWISPRLGQPSTWTATALENLADIMATIGIGTGGSTGRIPRLVAQLRQVRTDLFDWSRVQREKDQASYVQMVCMVADLTLTLAGATLAKAQAMTGNMVDLLRTWAADPNAVIQLTARPEWLLDGWEQICLIWQHAQDDAGRRAALIEIVGLIPVLPKEVSAWSSAPSDLDDSLRLRRLIPLNEDWRTGASFFEKVARNEHFRAIAC